MKLEDAEKVALLDEAVTSAQELCDVFVKFLEEEPATGKKDSPEAHALVEPLLVAFATFWFANRAAINTVASAIVGELPEIAESWDF